MDDLAATSDSLREDAREVVEIEDEKQGLAADDPRLASLSREAERLAGQVQQKSRIERDLAEAENESERRGPSN
jgi:hypothetical protein